MPQFLISEGAAGRAFALRGPEAFHVAKVLRRREGDSLTLFDGKGGRYRGVIRAVSAAEVSGEIVETLSAPETAAARLELYLGLLKPAHWEWALEKGTEIGVAAFVPVITPRTVVRISEISPAKCARWTKIMTAAAKQCGRGTIPELRQPAHFRDAIAEACAKGLTLLGWEKGGETSTCPGLREALSGERAEGGRTVSLFIGPEGGFSDEEVELAGLKGARLFSLGPQTYRADTAAAVAAALVLHELGFR